MMFKNVTLFILLCANTIGLIVSKDINVRTLETHSGNSKVRYVRSNVLPEASFHDIVLSSKPETTTSPDWVQLVVNSLNQIKNDQNNFKDFLRNYTTTTAPTTSQASTSNTQTTNDNKTSATTIPRISTNNNNLLTHLMI